MPRYHAFLARFPDPAACAAAPVAEVVRLWAGLGLQPAGRSTCTARAVAVVERHGGRLPDDLGALLALPGVGPYTARAVLAFAFERPVGVVDTNVGRVLARWAGRPAAPDRGPGAGRRPGGERRARRRRAVVAVEPVGDGARWGRCAAGAVPTAAPARSARGARGRPTAWPRPIPRTDRRACRPGQPRFEGSDRQGRGRLVAALCAGPVPAADVAAVMGWPDDPARADRVAVGLLADGLAVREGPLLRLP